ncbi:hypothetical protein LTS18_012646 [Coniosporium uncinatum]|uniref:Uncharacterized protein n=1 Tax=Coniosporium uncinatum TaxID=93489 RepID=A0ACC3CX21_9PEZI|nr:hypothetical protein LTS18_012646 [Coniosporium uncinatum]
MSPAILLRSGIGAKSDLEALGIDCVVNLPAVGKNLEDHLIVFTFYEVNQPGLTNDHLVYHGDSAKSTYELYKDTKTGFLSTFPFGAIAYARLDDRLAEDAVWQDAVKKAAEEGNVEGEGRDPMGLAPNQPNVEYFSVECYGGPKQYVDAPIAGQHVLGMVNLLFHARSRGSVNLASADPHKNPKIDCNYLDDPLDMVVLSEACRFSNEFLLKGKGTKSVLDGSWPRELTHHAYNGREEWEPYVRQHATTCYHPAGTCRMGRPDEENAVLDAKLKVRGVEGLRVVDVSAMPRLNQGHTQMPAYGIGEKAADLIRADAKLSQKT